MTSPLNWQDFLQQASLPTEASCLCNPHQQHALVRVSGSDAQGFLHAQLSNSVTDLESDEVRFAAWCNAKGRVWTLLRYWKDGDAIILRIPADQAEDSIKRLRMFVLRSDVQFERLDWKVIQFLGPDAEAQAKALVKGAASNSFYIPLPAAWPLYEVWSLTSSLSSDLPELPGELTALPRILAGIPEIFADQREEWIPQMLNLDRLNGIDFNKGCYPGQEIVAKLHYKGGLKQRMFRATTALPIDLQSCGAIISNEDGKTVGSVLESAVLHKELKITCVLRTEEASKLLSVDNQTLSLLPDQQQ